MKLFLRILGVLLLACFVFFVAGLFATWALDRSGQRLSVKLMENAKRFEFGIVGSKLLVVK
jgi:hypothetical protein